MVEALIDHESIGQDECLSRVIRLNEGVDHDIASLDILSSQAFLHAFSFNESELRFKIRYLFLEPRNNDSSIHSLILLHIILNHLDRTSEATCAQTLMDVVLLSRDRGHHLGVTVAA